MTTQLLVHQVSPIIVLVNHPGKHFFFYTKKLSSIHYSHSRVLQVNPLITIHIKSRHYANQIVAFPQAYFLKQLSTSAGFGIIIIIWYLMFYVLFYFRLLVHTSRNYYVGSSVRQSVGPLVRKLVGQFVG